MHESSTKQLIYDLYNALECPENASIMAWGEHGESFLMLHPACVARIVAKHRPKHHDTDSFVEALHRYGFRQRRCTDDVLRIHGEQVLELRHQCFRRGRADLLENIHGAAPARSSMNVFMSPKYYSSNKVMYLQQQLITTIVATSKNLQSLCERVSVLKQEVLKRNSLKRFKSPKVVVLEEDICTRISLTSFLKKAGFNVYIAESGNDVVFKCSQKRFELIILSHSLHSALSLLKRIAMVKRHATVVLTCSSSDVACIDDIKKTGVDEVLFKPYSEENIVSILRKFSIF